MVVVAGNKRLIEKALKEMLLTVENQKHNLKKVRLQVSYYSSNRLGREVVLMADTPSKIISYMKDLADVTHFKGETLSVEYDVVRLNGSNILMPVCATIKNTPYNTWVKREFIYTYDNVPTYMSLDE